MIEACVVSRLEATFPARLLGHNTMRGRDRNGVIARSAVVRCVRSRIACGHRVVDERWQQRSLGHTPPPPGACTDGRSG